MNTRKKKRDAVLFLILLAAMACGVFSLSLPVLADRDSVRRLFDRHQEELHALAESAKDKFLDSDDLDLMKRLAFFRSGLSFIDGRNAGERTVFVFHSINPEGDIRLIYSPQGEAGVLEWIGPITGRSWTEIPAAGIYMEGLGINGKGYLFCEELLSDWYLVDMYFPT